MIIYKDANCGLTTEQDLVSGDEIISDTWELKDVDDAVYEVDCKKVTKNADNIDIGANPSAEEAEEALDEGQTQVIDVVDAFRLNQMQGVFKSKKDFQGQLKGYLKKVVEKKKEDGATEDDIKKFQKGVQEYYTKKLVPNFGDLDFYATESMDPDGM
ncbi:hypothetical protein MMC21_004975 [Puttea exsequens]|nr:hypothetical protein [Puttea exsequens]